MDTERLALGFGVGGLGLLDATKMKRVRDIYHHEDAVIGVDMCQQDASLLLSRSLDGVLAVHDVREDGKNRAVLELRSDKCRVGLIQHILIILPEVNLLEMEIS